MNVLMRRYYFDHNATTPVAPEVLEAMLPYLRDNYGNASSIHSFGQDARAAVERARRQVAALLNAKPSEIVFTSGGTESDNLAVLGVVRASDRDKRHVISTTIEHPAVLNTCRRLEEEGVEVTFLSAGENGVVSVDGLRAAIRPETVLITIMHANNELGTLQPIAEMAQLAREAGIPFHTDGVQSSGKIPVDVGELGVDLFSLSGHKIYAPKGVGALFVRKGTVLDAILFGGRHERGFRPGTENVPGIVGLGQAAALARKNLEQEGSRLSALRDRLEKGILEHVEFTTLNGEPSKRTPNTTNIRFEYIEGEAMVIALDLKGMAVSSGAACSSGAVLPSHVLTAIGLSTDQARSSLRFSLGKQNTDADVDALLKAILEVVTHLRKLSPAYAG
jgi:cysteine desulfurase